MTETSPPAAGRPTRARRVAYALSSIIGAFVVTGFVLFAADIYAHRRTEEVAGVNTWGYRGSTVGPKRPGERRIVILGGSTVFGFGLPARESIAAFLERRLQSDARMQGRSVSVVNLGAPGQGAYGFRFDLADYEYLDFDAAILYEGYNDLVGPDQRFTEPNHHAWRHESTVFRLTGYYPILPELLRDKALGMLYGGDLVAATTGKPVAFRPGLATRTTAGAMSAAARISEQVSRQLGRLSDSPPPPSVDERCIDRWREYCGSVRWAVEWLLARNKRAVFVTQPYISDLHVEQQANVTAMLGARFGGDRRLTMVNLGRLIDLTDHRIAYDGLHLVAAGNDQVAEQLVDPVIEILR